MSLTRDLRWGLAGLLVGVVAVTASAAPASATGLTWDVSSVGLAYSGYCGGATCSQTTGSFDPPGGAVVVLDVFSRKSYTDHAWAAPTVTDSLGSHLTWSLAASSDVTGGILAEWVYWAYVGGTSPGSMTATVTTSAGSDYVYWIESSVDVWDGADTGAPIGATVIGTGTSSAPSVSITPTTSSSALLFGTVDDQTSGTFTAGGGEYTYGDNSGEVDVSWDGSSSGPSFGDAGGTPVGLSGTLSTSADWVAIGYEVVPAPVVTTTTTSSSTTTTTAATTTTTGATTTTEAVLAESDFASLATGWAEWGGLGFIIGLVISLASRLVGK